MPHKRNPAGSLLALEAAARAPGLAATLLGELAPEHERGLGQWQSQWLTLRSLACATGSALAAMAEVLQALSVDEQAMRANLERTHGLVYSEAVSLRLTREVADRLCEQALTEGRSLREVTQAAGLLSQEELEALFNPRLSFGAAPVMIDRVLAEWASARGSAA
jgi:3-carboxy-cis,cis-muconate cycloisomerase